MNPSLKLLLLALLKAILALLRTPTNEEKSIRAQKKNLDAIIAQIKTQSGDDILAEDDVQELIGDLVTVAETSTPHDDYAEKPALEDLLPPEPEEPAAEEEEPAAEEEEPAAPKKRASRRG